MRIALVTDCYKPVINGVVTSVGIQANALRQAGHEVQIFAPNHEEAPPEEEVTWFASRPFWLHKEERFTYPWPPASLKRLWSKPFDVVHIQTPFNLGFTALMATSLRRLPRVFTHHTLWEEYVHYLPIPQRYTRPAALGLCHYFLNGVDRVITPSAEVRTRLRGQGFGGSVDVIPTGIDVNVFRGGKAEDANLDFDDDTIIFLYVGRLGKEKSVDQVLKAFHSAREEMPNLRLLVVGDGPARQELEELNRQLGQGATFLGFQPRERLKDFMALARAFLFASVTETQGLVLLEAQAASVPVVAVRASGTNEAVDPDRTGVILEEGDLKGFSAAILDFAKHPDKARKMGVSAASWAEEFSSSAMADKMVDSYTLAIQSKRA